MNGFFERFFVCYYFNCRIAVDFSLIPLVLLVGTRTSSELTKIPRNRQRESKKFDPRMGGLWQTTPR
jgi:hypothetical protein